MVIWYYFNDKTMFTWVGVFTRIQSLGSILGADSLFLWSLISFIFIRIALLWQIYMHTNLALHVLNDYIIYICHITRFLTSKLTRAQVVSNYRITSLPVEALTDCATGHSDNAWDLFIYWHIHWVRHCVNN